MSKFPNENSYTEHDGNSYIGKASKEIVEATLLELYTQFEVRKNETGMREFLGGGGTRAEVMYHFSLVIDLATSELAKIVAGAASIDKTETENKAQMEANLQHALTVIERGVRQKAKGKLEEFLNFQRKEKEK